MQIFICCMGSTLYCVHMVDTIAVLLFDLGVSLVIALASFGALKYLKKMEVKRAAKISAVVFLASATIVGIILIWLSTRIVAQPMYGVHAMYGVEAYINQSCIQQCEQIADKASEAFQNCARACRIR